MNWLGRLLMELFPPEPPEKAKGLRKTPSGGYIGVADNNSKDYMKWLGTSGLEESSEGTRMMKDGRWQRVPPLADWLRRGAK